MHVLILCELGLKTPIDASKIVVLEGCDPLNGEQSHRDPQIRHFLHRTHYMTCRYQNRLTGAGCVQAGGILRNRNLTSHMFTETTHTVATPHGFACVVIPMMQLYIPSFIEIYSGVFEPWGVEIWPFPLLWLLLYNSYHTSCHEKKIKLQMLNWHNTCAN